MGQEVTVVGATNTASYAATFVGLVGVAAATDIVTITGATNRVVKVARITISGIATAAAVADVQIVRRTTANTGGTSGSVTPVQRGDLLRDTSGNIVSYAAQATVLTYTANPTLGTATAPSGGTLAAAKMSIGTASGTTSTPLVFDFTAPGMSQPTLRGAADVLAINLNGGTYAGNAYTGTIEFTEISQ